MSQAKRGYVPGDDREFSGKSLDKLRLSARQVQSGILAGLRGDLSADRRDIGSRQADSGFTEQSSGKRLLIPDVDRTLMEKDCVVTADAIILDTCKSWFNLLKLCMDDLAADLIQVW